MLSWAKLKDKAVIPGQLTNLKMRVVKIFWKNLTNKNYNREIKNGDIPVVNSAEIKSGNVI